MSGLSVQMLMVSGLAMATGRLVFLDAQPMPTQNSFGERKQSIPATTRPNRTNDDVNHEATALQLSG